MSDGGEPPPNKKRGREQNFHVGSIFHPYFPLQQNLSFMSLPSLHWRYAVKRFDPTRKIPEDVWLQIEQSLVLTPSSFGLQPWKFIVIRSDAIKSELVGASWNQTQPRDCSHMIALAALREVPVSYVDEFIASIQETRDVTLESLQMYRKVILDFMEVRRGRQFEWAANQVYIALGQLMATAAMLEVDSCPMEGLDPAKYDQILGLTDTEYGVVVGCALGYRHPDDKYALAKKVRFHKDRVIEIR